MTARWDPCVAYEGKRAEDFLRTFFEQGSRRILFVGAAGFDPRSTAVATALASTAASRMKAVFIREQRPEPSDRLLALADANEAALRALCPDVEIVPVDIF